MLVYLLFQSEFSVCFVSGECLHLLVLFSIKKTSITEVRNRVNVLEMRFRLSIVSVADHEIADVCLMGLKNPKYSLVCWLM